MKVSVTKEKLDALANAVSSKSGESIPLTIDEMTDAVDGIQTGGSATLITKNITANGTYSAQDDSADGYSSVSVSVSAPAPTLQTKSVTPTETAQTVTADVGYDGLDEVDVGAISSTYVGSGITTHTSPYTPIEAEDNYVIYDAGYYPDEFGYTVPYGSVTTPSTISGTSASVSTGTNTLTLSKTISVTPDVTQSGYISSGTAGNSSVSLTASVTTKAAATITPSTSNQTIASGTYLTGTQTISGDANLVAGNIKSGTSIFGITGMYSGGGVSGVAKGTLTVASNVNTSTNTKITDTTTIGFTPKCFLFYRSDRSATSNHVNQASFVTLGSSYYVRTMTRYSSNALSTSGNTNNWTTQTSGYLYFNSNNIYFRSSSSYILPSGTWYWVAIQ